VLLVEPQYAEYRHVAERLVGCPVDSFRSEAPSTIADLASSLRMRRYKLVVLVDPNNPLGYRFDPDALVDVLLENRDTMFWVDRTYAPFAGDDHGLERFAAASPNTIVGMSMSKAYALSGMRLGYLCGPTSVLADAWRLTPPWLISRPAGAAAVAALSDSAYYAARYRETAALREELVDGLRRIPGLEPREGVANYVFCELREPLDAATVVERLAARGVYVRAFPTDMALRWRAIRIAVLDHARQSRLLVNLREVVDEIHAAREGLAVPA
jgi:histidinol-phosphate/aromatic aminotransferase/cobyric acid decarboxylase-like protein